MPREIEERKGSWANRQSNLPKCQEGNKGVVAERGDVAEEASVCHKTMVGFLCADFAFGVVKYGLALLRVV